MLVLILMFSVSVNCEFFLSVSLFLSCSYLLKLVPGAGESGYLELSGERRNSSK